MKTSLTTALFISALFTSALLAAEGPKPEKLSLWPEKAPVGDGSFETANVPITVYRPAPEKANGAAFVICPGGGYSGHAVMPEGHLVAQWLNRHGIAGIVLEYRMPRGRFMVPLVDAQRAVRTVRAKAAEWKIDPAKIGILGFSAGGHLASTAGTHFDAGDLQAADPIDRLSCRPDFMVLIYPVITMGELTHGGSKHNLLGRNPKPDLVERFSNEKQVTAATPPAFLAHAKDDRAVVPENSRRFAEALRAHNVAAEYLQLPHGGHGLHGYQGPMWDAWQNGTLAWLAAQKFIPGGAAPAKIEVTLDGRGEGRTFEGLGALSAGASSRMLMEYPEPHRSRILDFLFKPNFGAAFHHCKVEIGGDVNSTDGTEPSHARTREEFDHPKPEYYDRGYEWWIMREAKKRNPQVALDILQWGAPGWIGGKGDDRKKFYSQDNADFIAAFIHGAKKHHNLDIDFCGIWNEKPRDNAWIKLLRKTLDRQGLARVRIIAADEVFGKPWDIVNDVTNDREFRDAIYAIGVHYPRYLSTPDAMRCGKPLWSSEDGPWRGDWPGACALAKHYNRNYIQGRMTKTTIWSLISSYYEILPLPNSGPMKANQPWSGHYEVQPAVWAIAHTTQFAQPGWKYLDAACGLLKSEGSYVALRSPAAGGDYSIVIETVDAKSPQTMTFRVTGGLADKPVHVWRTTQQSQFDRLADIPLTNGSLTVTLDPGAIYSITTTTGQAKSRAESPPPADFPCPYADDFESYTPGKYARHFADQAGVFEVVKRGDGAGQCLRQVMPQDGILWRPDPEPYSIIGSTKWRHYEVIADARIEKAGYVALYGRVVCAPGSVEPARGYWLKVSDSGQWQLRAFTRVLAEGRVPFAADQWHSLKLKFAGPQITVAIDGKDVKTIADLTYKNGMVALGTGWNCGQFDNLAIRPLDAREPTDLALGKRATASSNWGDEQDAKFANDGNGGTRWNSAQGKGPGEWLEIDFGKRVRFNTVRLSQPDPRIKQYKIQYADGAAWRDAATGDAAGLVEWTDRFNAVEAQKVRLLIVGTRGKDPVNDTPTICEFEVYELEHAMR